MSKLARLRSLWRNLRHRAEVDRDLDEELDSYADLLADEQRSTGADPEMARRAVRLRIGGMQQVKEAVRDSRSGAGLETVWHDVRFGARLLQRTPSFAVAVITSLALGIGANSAVFGLLNALRLRSLPVARPHELAEIRLDGSRCCRHTGRNRQVSMPLWREIAQHQQAFSALVAFSDTRFNLAPHGEVRYVEGLFVSGEFFRVLGVDALLGRTLRAEDDRPGCGAAPVVISHALWQSEFAGRADVLARSLTLRSGQHPIVGVMPPAFFGVEVGRRFEVAMPLCASGFERRDHWWLAVMGRLRPGWTPEQASVHLAALGPSLLGAVIPPNYSAELAKQFVDLPLSVRSAPNGISPLRSQYEDPLWLLLAIAGLVLLTACANVASLSLVRATTRERELALRFALGASRPRVIRQLLVEGALIALAGAGAALALARVTSHAIITLLSTPTDRIVLDLSADWRVLTFSAVLVGVTTVVFALAPALRALRGVTLTPDGARTTHGRRRVAMREVLVTVQVALSVVLVSASIVFLFTLRNLMALQPGFRAEEVLVANVFLVDKDHPAPTRSALQRELAERFSAVPGVVGVAHASTPPLGGAAWGTVVRVVTRDGDVKEEVVRNEVSAGYFGVLQTAFIAGRDFGGQDTPASPRVAVVNETFARTFYKDGTPLGRRFRDGDQEFEIVGVVRDSKQYWVREEYRPIVYTAASQVAEPSPVMRFLLRSAIGTAAVVDPVRHVVREVSPAASLRFATLAENVSTSLLLERLMARLSTFFGIIALVLAAVGVYGVVAYTVATRQREIGIRLALGARSADVLGTLLGRAILVVGMGIVLGVVLTMWGSRLATSLLFGVQPGDLLVQALLLAVIVASGLLAMAAPARRALRTDPVVALKHE